MSSNSNNNVDNLRKACWGQFQNSYNKFSSVFSDAVFKHGCVSVHAPDFLNKMGLSQNIIVKTRPNKFICRCMDERCQQIRVEGEELEDYKVVDLALPGVGSLLTFAELAKHAESILKKAKLNNIESIELCAHEGCGAAALARPKFETITGIMDGTSDEIERFFGRRAYEVFQKVNQDEGYGVKIISKYQTADTDMMQINTGDGNCCRKIHPALGIMINNFEGLDFGGNRASVHDLLLKSELPFFLITDYGEAFDDHTKESKLRWKSTAKEVELASNIIAGDHGMGADFNLPIIFLVNSRESKLRARKLIQIISQQLISSKFTNTLQNPVHHHFIMIDFMEKK